MSLKHIVAGNVPVWPRGAVIAVTLLALMAAPIWAESAEYPPLPPGSRTIIGDTPWDPASLQGSDEKIIFGEDDRIDTYQETDPERLQWAASTCGLFMASDVTENADGSFTIDTYAYTYFGYPPCDEVPFGNQPASAFCSGFIVGSDLIATAGHCIDESDLDLVYFIFGFEMLDETTPVTTFPAAQVYRGVEMLGRKLEGYDDYAVLRVDRPIVAADAVPFALREEGEVAIGESVGAIGYPSGLPVKLAFGEDTVVVDNSPEEYFSANIDVFGGNSGGPTINSVTGVIEGIAVRAFRPGRYIDGDCFSLLVFEDDDDVLYYTQSSKTSRWLDIVTEAQNKTADYDFRVTPTWSNERAPVLSLSWVNPDEEAFTSVTLIRAIGGFPEEEDDGEVVYEGKESKYLDEDVINGVEYFYTLIVDTLAADGETVVPEADYARGVAGTVVNVLTEAFGPDITEDDNRFDLVYKQLLFSPVNAPLADINNSGVGGSLMDYEVTTTHNVYTMPVAREDTEGGSFQLDMSEDGYITLDMTGAPFPFFGRLYSRLYMAANGYVAFSPPEAINNFLTLTPPTTTPHFADPRISFLFTDLAPTVGGEVWVRVLEDRIALTVMDMPEHPWPIYLKKANLANSVQVELFRSGHIRMTYQEVGVDNVIVGLSDGNGAPVDPADLFEGVRSVPTMSDLSESPKEPERLTTEVETSASDLIMVDAGDVAEYEIVAVAPADSEGTPALDAEWERDEAVPFGDNGDGTGTFYWRVPVEEEGLFTVRVTATLDGAKAYTDTRIYVGATFIQPVALNLGISTDSPFEDPRANRLVDTELALMAEYDYFHPFAEERPDLYGEGDSYLFWYRNGQIVPSLNNSPTVPARATAGKDEWYFKITPITVGYVLGEEAISPVVTIAAYPIIESIDPSYGLVAGGETVRITGRRLNGATEVTFGAVAGSNVRVFSDSEIEVTTPLHGIGTVPVVVTTSEGSGRLSAGFTFITDLGDLLIEDVNEDGKVDATDVQRVSSKVLELTGAKEGCNCDANRDGRVNAADIQVVVNRVLHR